MEDRFESLSIENRGYGPRLGQVADSWANAFVEKEAAEWYQLSTKI